MTDNESSYELRDDGTNWSAVRDGSTVFSEEVVQVKCSLCHGAHRWPGDESERDAAASAGWESV